MLRTLQKPPTDSIAYQTVSRVDFVREAGHGITARVNAYWIANLNKAWPKYIYRSNDPARSQKMLRQMSNRRLPICYSAVVKTVSNHKL